MGNFFEDLGNDMDRAGRNLAVNLSAPINAVIDNPGKLVNVREQWRMGMDIGRGFEGVAENTNPLNRFLKKFDEAGIKKGGRTGRFLGNIGEYARTRPILVAGVVGVAANVGTYTGLTTSNYAGAGVTIGSSGAASLSAGQIATGTASAAGIAGGGSSIAGTAGAAAASTLLDNATANNEGSKSNSGIQNINSSWGFLLLSIAIISTIIILKRRKR